MTTLYGIPTCDTVKKARRWLEQAGIDYQFHDFRKNGLERAKLERWVAQRGLTTVLNKRSTSWKQLPETQRSLDTTPELVNLMLEHPTLIKRPVLEHTTGAEIGFNEAKYEKLFS